MDRDLRLRVLEEVASSDNKSKYYNDSDPLAKEGYGEREVHFAIDTLKKDGLLENNTVAMKWWTDDRLSFKGRKVLDKIQEERDDKVYWDMLMEDHRRAG